MKTSTKTVKRDSGLATDHQILDNVLNVVSNHIPRLNGLAMDVQQLRQDKAEAMEHAKFAMDSLNNLYRSHIKLQDSFIEVNKRLRIMEASVNYLLMNNPIIQDDSNNDGDSQDDQF